MLIFPIGPTSRQVAWLDRHLGFLANPRPCSCNSTAYRPHYSLHFDQINAAVLAGCHAIDPPIKVYSLVYCHKQVAGVQQSDDLQHLQFQRRFGSALQRKLGAEGDSKGKLKSWYPVWLVPCIWVIFRLDVGNCISQRACGICVVQERAIE